jgi:hypothetical protein
MNDGFYLHQWLSRLQFLEERLAARLPKDSLLPTRAKTLRTQVEQAVVAQTDLVLDGLIENVFLPQLDKLLQEAKQALNLTQYARNTKQKILTPRQNRLLQQSMNESEIPDIPLFQGTKLLKRDANNREKIEDALAQLKEFLL